MSPVHLDDRLTDADAAQAMAVINEAMLAGPPRHTMPISYARARRGSSVGLPPAVPCRVRDAEIPGGAGPIRARVYEPATTDARFTVLYLHGGGWAVGDLEINDGVCRVLADAAGAAIVSIDYRLAPEHPFPAALHDGAAALRWLDERGAREWRLPAPVAVAGLSAGGALAATLARWGRDGLAPATRHQLLLCPVTDSDTDRPSYRAFADGLLLSADDMRWFIDMYTAGDAGLLEDPDAFPNRALDVAGLPPATLVVAGADPLRDEAVEYAERMSAAGADVAVDVVPGVFHGFMAVPGVASGRAALRRAAERLAGAVAS